MASVALQGQLTCMQRQPLPRPSVPSRPTRPGYGSGRGTSRTEGAKNPWENGYGCQHVYLATYNVRTLLTEERYQELESEVLNKIKWDIMGLSETRRRGENLLKLTSGHLLYCKGYEDKSQGGVGLLINTSMAKKMRNIGAVSPRVIYATFDLNKRYSLKVIQVYAPTSSHSDDEVSEFYDDISTALRENPTFYTTVIGDFNAKLGKPEKMKSLWADSDWERGIQEGMTWQVISANKNYLP
ncbi:hypothetical protein MSG28_014049 [Choristoneura fumiferana]|uniref:Uncharacterized protein n=1 Tax=Choristoneura fumiferana TaxID=7141 RepID=A0ACC0JFL9_CHOFU|nr:hypothetical protein MSG28_014049 [Choristoneura fumiferana]